MPLRRSPRALLSFVPLVPVAAALACSGTTTVPPAAPVATPTAAAAPTAELPLAASIDESLLDPSVSPCDDFYAHACGGWMKANAIPADKSVWARGFSVLAEKNAETLRGILEQAAAGKGDADNPYAKAMGDLYASCIDEDAIEAHGLGELTEELRHVDDVKDATTLAREVARLHANGIPALFRFGSETDAKNATQVIGYVRQGGLTLPDRDYYLKDDPKSAAMRQGLQTHVEAMLVLAGEKPADAKAHAATILRFETDLATPQMPRVDMRDPDKVYHRIDRQGLVAAAPAFAWDAYFDALGYGSVSAINVWQPDYAKALAAMTKTVPMATFRTYLRWKLVHAAAPALGRAMVAEDFHFRQLLSGAKVIEPRWRRCVREVDDVMGEALGRSFAKTALGADGKATVSRMVDALLASMHEDIDGLAWMDAETRSKATTKLGAIAKKIGYPDSWRSYDGLTIDRASHLGNVLRGQAFEEKRERDKIGHPVDRNEWDMTPPTINAYYRPDMNDVSFPAGILQPPYFGAEQPRAMSFGAIGVVMGHEITHGFDDEGRKYDADGNLRDWWTAASGTEFEKRAQCVVDQFDGYAPFPDAHVNGHLTLGENIADLGGVKIALAALRRAQHDDPPHARYAYSDEKLFFYGFAQSWCENVRDERLRMLLTVDPHAPARYRVNGPLSNSPEFAATFKCAAGTNMVRAQRCDVW